mmetsp:Transcript_31359/g.50668  ORF Transcript_31359/g.50668 Transcript_31359/m.50668 type:complete len:82 (-) Transcript_31359:1265-1510(-)
MQRYVPAHKPACTYVCFNMCECMYMYCIFVYGLHVCVHVRIHTCEFELIQFSKILICRTHPIFAQKSPEFLEDPVAPPRVK